VSGLFHFRLRPYVTRFSFQLFRTYRKPWFASSLSQPPAAKFSARQTARRLLLKPVKGQLKFFTPQN
jgi:hypothetical protein